MQEDEILSVARFKLGETARRIAVLAESASDPAVREALLALVVALLAEQRVLTYRSRSAA